MISTRPYITKAINDWILNNGWTPYLLIDATKENVVVPEEYVDDGQIVLNISPTAVRGLDIGEEFISFDGRFGRHALTVFVPFEALIAIYAYETGLGTEFENDIVAVTEGAEPFDRQLFETQAHHNQESTPKEKTGRPSLRVIK